MEGTPFGRYRLIELLGRGGMGEVWRAYDTATNNRTVAIKLLAPQLAEDDTFVQRFRREADAAARLNNPHIIPIHNYGEIDGRLYVDMRLIEGRDLKRCWPTVRCRRRERWRSLDRWPRRCRRRIESGWCTATSSRPTSCSTGMTSLI